MQPEDGAAVLRIFEEGIATKNATFDQYAPSWEVWDINHLNKCRWILQNDSGDIVGWCALKPISNRECYSGVAEVSIYLTLAAQGKGLGTMLLQKLILDSEQNNFWTLQAGIFPENEASIAVHQKLGFKIVGTREKIAKMDSRWRDVILLERRSNII